MTHSEVVFKAEQDEAIKLAFLSLSDDLQTNDLQTNGSVNENALPPNYNPVDSARISANSANSKEQSEADESAAFKQLQKLLVEPELAEFRPLIAEITQKLARLEHQIYEPAALVKLLTPWVAELLRCKIAESKEEVGQAISLVIDRAIHNRIEENKPAVAAALAPVISATIAYQIYQSPEEVANAIAPMMGKAIQQQIRLEQDAMVDALYPVIGSTISKYMVEAIRSINEKIETTFSIEGIQRKLRAKLQGISEAELIFKEALPFTIQAIFLIDKDSGLVISEVQPRDSQQLESEMVAGMLTAIRSFVNDCIAQSGAALELDKIDYGDSKIILEVAGYCYLAVVIQGEPPRQFVQRTRQTLGTIVREFGSAIEQFEGNPTQVPAQIHPLLEALQDAYVSKQLEAKKFPTLLIGGLALLSLIAILLGIYQHQNYVDRRIESKINLALTAAPELAIYRLNAQAYRETLTLVGEVPNQILSEKAEEIAHAVAPKLALNNQVVAIEIPADPVLTSAEIKRVAAILNRIEGINISARYTAGKIAIEGKVNRPVDAQNITQAFQQVPGVRSITTTVQLQPLRLGVRFYFNNHSAQLQPADLTGKLGQVKAYLTQHPDNSLNIIGHYSSTDRSRETQALALQRANKIRDLLIRGGISPHRLKTTGTNLPPDDVQTSQPSWLWRCVEFRPAVEHQ